MEDTISIKKSFCELNYIINNMSQSMKNKIPDNVKELIKSHMDQGYIFDVDMAKKWTEQNYLPETKAFVSLLISEYIGDSELKRKWKEFDQEYANIENKGKNLLNKSNTNIDIFANQRTDQVSNNEEENNNQLVVVKKANIFSKIWKKIMCFFHKS